MRSAESETFPDGSRFGRYRIECELRPTRLGRVYKAFDTQLKVTVAISTLAPQLRTPEGMELLYAGVRLARQKGPHLAYDIGEIDGIPFAVLGYVEGVGAAVDIAEL
jgi:hypothetical protein